MRDLQLHRLASRRAVPWLAGLVLGAGLLSGCAGENPAGLAPFVVDTPHAFTAELLYSTGHEGTLTLSGPVMVWSSAGPMMAYRLQEQITSGTDAAGQDNSWYLDANFRTIVETRGCGFVIDCSIYEWWWWDRHGEYGVHGVGFPNLLSDGQLIEQSGGVEVEMEHEVLENSNDEALYLAIHHRTYSGATWEKQYVYSPGRMVPDDDRWTVTAYTPGAPLDGADALGLPSPSLPPAEWNGMLFPGETEDTFDIGVTHREIAEFAFPNLPEASCLVNYSLRPAGSTGAQTIPVPEVTLEKLADAKVGLLNHSELVLQNVEVKRDPVTGESQMTMGSQETRTSLTDCKEIARTPWPETSFHDALEFASEVLATDEVRQVTFDATKNLGWQVPETGLQWYHINFKSGSEASFNDPYEVWFDASEGKSLRKALVHPDRHPFWSDEFPT